MTDLVDVLEAAYDVHPSESEWLSRIARAVHPMLDDGAGALAWSFAPDANGAPCPRASGSHGMSEERLADFWTSSSSAEDRLALAEVYTKPVNSLRAQLGARFDAIELTSRLAESTGVVDVVSINAENPNGKGMSVGIPVLTPVTLTHGFKHRWGRVAAHLASSVRLRTLESDETARSDAVLMPSGVVVHAERDARDSAAREALRHAAIAIDRARGPMRHQDVDAALDAWAALVAGRWTLVDSFDSDGRRHLLARRNPPGGRGVVALTERERVVCGFRAAGHSLKLIAYELGLSIATVSRTLTSAMKKLGISSLGDLALVFR